MFSVSDKFKTYIAQYDRQFECRATIAGTVYGNDDVVSFEIEDSIASGEELELGSVIASKITIFVRTQNIIPVNAKITPEIRMNGTDGYTEWVPAGSFYIDSRNYQNNTWTLIGYDKLITVNQTFVSTLAYPAAMADVVNEICTQLGIILDASVVINPAYEIPYKDEEITIRDMLSYITSAHGACAKMTKDEKLTFVKFIASAASTLTVTPSDYVTAKQTNILKQYTKIKVTYNTDQEYLEAGIGDDDHTLKFYNQFMTQDILDDIFAVFNGFSYVPAEVSWKGNIYSEVGDRVGFGNGITWLGYDATWDTADITWDNINFFYSVVLRSKIIFKGGLRTEWSSPSASPQKSEFTFKGTLNQKVQNLEKTAVKEEKAYNGVVIGRTNGVVVTRSDNKADTKLNATEGILIRADGGSGLENVFEVVIQGDGTARLRLKGDIIMNGGSISWADVTPPTAAEVGAVDVNDLEFETVSIINNTVNAPFVNALNVTAGSVAAENITGTFMTGKTVRTAASGRRIVLGGNNLSTYNVDDHLHGFQMVTPSDPSNHSMAQFYHDNTMLLEFYDNTDGYGIFPADNKKLYIGSNGTGTQVIAGGIWSFEAGKMTFGMRSGTTSNRPANPRPYEPVFDTANQIIVIYTGGTTWKDAFGSVVWS